MAVAAWALVKIAHVSASVAEAATVGRIVLRTSTALFKRDFCGSPLNPRQWKPAARDLAADSERSDASDEMISCM